MKTKLREVLSKKSGDLVHIDPQASLRDAAERLCEHRIGALLVTNEEGALVGILSERDIMRALAQRIDVDATTVVATMTRKLIVAVEEDDVAHAMHVMTKARIRHLPIMRNNALVGLLSIGDLVNAVRGETEKQVRYLQDYLEGKYW